MVAGFCVTHNPYFKLGADLQSASVLRRKAEDFFLERSLNLKGVAGVKDLHWSLALVFYPLKRL